MRVAIAILVAIALVGSIALADTASVKVIVHPKNPATKLSKQFVADAFLKKRTRWSGDTPIQPIDLVQSHAARARFTRAVLDRDVAAVRRYWAQLVFSGRGVPPPHVADEADVIAYVAKYPNAIGYVSATTPLTGVKAVVIE